MTQPTHVGRDTRDVGSNMHVIAVGLMLRRMEQRRRSVGARRLGRGARRGTYDSQSCNGSGQGLTGRPGCRRPRGSWPGRGSRAPAATRGTAPPAARARRACCARSSRWLALYVSKCKSLTRAPRSGRHMRVHERKENCRTYPCQWTWERGPASYPSRHARLDARRTVRRGPRPPRCGAAHWPARGRGPASAAPRPAARCRPGPRAPAPRASRLPGRSGLWGSAPAHPPSFQAAASQPVRRGTRYGRRMLAAAHCA